MRLQALPVILCFAACGDSAETSSSKISADEGGTVTLGSKQTKIQIPKAALPEDTEVMLEIADHAKLPALDDVAAVLRIEPEGLELKSSAAVTIELPTEVAENQPVASYQLVGDEWVSLGSTIAIGKLVETVVSSFAPVAITVGEAKETPADGNRIIGTATWKDESPATIPIELWQNDKKLTETTTDDKGNYSFVDLTPGEYVIVLTHMAECPAEHPVTVTAEKATELDIIVCGR